MSLSRARGSPPVRNRSRSESNAASSAQRARLEFTRFQEHVRKSGMGGKLLHGAAVRSDLAR
jgi:hypothetical protein